MNGGEFRVGARTADWSVLSLDAFDRRLVDIDRRVAVPGHGECPVFRLEHAGHRYYFARYTPLRSQSSRLVRVFPSR